MKKNDKALSHTPVLLDEAINGLMICSGGIYIDATFGRGGHSKQILKKLDGTGRLLALDQDLEAVSFAKENFHSANFHIRNDSFANIAGYVSSLDLLGKVNGILLDLGVSSPQLENSQRGFSFMRDGPLDMRMNLNAGITAKQWLQQISEGDLKKVLKDYGEERFAGIISKNIKKEMELNNLNTTLDLANLVKRVSPKTVKNKHPATRTFQAIRIAVNGELEALHSVLDATINVLASGGRLVVISFHSLEDRIVKQFMKKKSTYIDLYPESPVAIDGIEPVLKTIGKPVFSTKLEQKNNPRSRSAVLRIAEKL